MDIKGQIIEAVDKELEATGAPYLTLAHAHKLLIKEGIITQAQKSAGFLKYLLSAGEIPNAIQTNNAPKQWRLTHSGKNTTEHKPSEHITPVLTHETVKNDKGKSTFWSFYPLYIIIAGILVLFIHNTITENAKLAKIRMEAKAQKDMTQLLENQQHIGKAISFLKELEDPKYVPDITYKFTFSGKKDQISAVTQTFQIPNPSRYSVMDTKLGYLESFYYRFAIDSTEAISEKSLMLNYSSNTTITADFYTDILKEFINITLAKKELELKKREIDKESALEKKREIAQLAEQKKREAESKKEATKNARKKENKIHSYESTFFTIEYDNGEAEKVNETTFHIFDLNNNTITLLSIINGKWVKSTLKATRYYKENFIYTMHVFEINNSVVSKLWINFDNETIVYDYNDGTRITCYGISRNSD